MPERRAEEELEINRHDRKHSKSSRAWGSFIGQLLRIRFSPISSRIKRHEYGDREEGLSERRMCAGDVPRKEIENRQPAKDSLPDDRADRRQAEIAEPAPFIDSKRRDAEQDRQESDSLGDHAMRMFELHAADHRRNLVDRSKRRRPIRN